MPRSCSAGTRGGLSGSEVPVDWGPGTTCASPEFAGDPRAESVCAPPSLHFILVARAVERRGEGRGHCHFKSGEVRPPEVMVTSASSPPPARERGSERENLFSFITFSFSFLSVNYLFLARLRADRRGRSSAVVTGNVATPFCRPCPRLAAPRLFRKPSFPLKCRQIFIYNPPCHGLAFWRPLSP